jgi:glycerate 2-kinase
MTMKILVAPNAFKNSLDAGSAAEAIANGIKASRLKCECVKFPIADGGDGTGELLSKYLNAETLSVVVHNPLGKKIESKFAITKDKTAIIEMADASGIRLLNRGDRDIMHSSSYGTGELIRAALDAGARKIILGVGGTATVDGGAGILSALGARFLEAKGHELEPVPAELVHLDRISLSNFDRRALEVEIDILCDVTNPLIGEYGAAQMFGPQKGASEHQVQELEKVLTNLADVIEKEKSVSIRLLQGGGAAGGVPAALHGICNARLANGIEYFLNVTKFDSALKGCDLVITAEGSIDEQTLQGKGPAGVALSAKRHNIPVIAFAGAVPLTQSSSLDELFHAIMPISNRAAQLSELLQDTAKNLERTARETGNLLALSLSA